MAKANASKKTDEQLRSGIKKYQKIIEQAYSRDINESDTAIIIRDFLADVLNFDRYSEITTEYSIKGTYCDLAIRQNGKISLIIEVKAIGIDLKEIHARQAIDYATKEGVDWVLLTNGITWQAYKLFFSKPVVTEMVF